MEKIISKNYKSAIFVILILVLMFSFYGNMPYTSHYMDDYATQADAIEVHHSKNDKVQNLNKIAIALVN